MEKVCSITRCNRETIAHGWCRLHYLRWYRSGTTDLVPRIRVDVECATDGCTSLARVKGQCRRHYRTPRRCSVPGCSRSHNKKGVCATHEYRHRRGIPDSEPIGPKHAPVVVNGYVKVWSPNDSTAKDGYVLEHRLIMSRKLGRPLLRSEHVHHKNRIRNDNRLSNLELWITAHPTGGRVEDLVDDAVRLLRQYRPELLSC